MMMENFFQTSVIAVVTSFGSGLVMYFFKKYMDMSEERVVADINKLRGDIYDLKSDLKNVKIESGQIIKEISSIRIDFALLAQKEENFNDRFEQLTIRFSELYKKVEDFGRVRIKQD